jgi:nicotinamide mononucleotide (NMN) deamidase PncC
VLNNILAKVFGTSNERAVKRLLPVLAQINSHEEALLQFSDEQLSAKTAEFKARIAASIEGITGPEEPKRKPSTRCCRRPSPSSARLGAASSACATSMCR